MYNKNNPTLSLQWLESEEETKDIGSNKAGSNSTTPFQWLESDAEQEEKRDS